MTRDWDDAFANMAHIPGSEALPEIWQNDAAAYRASGVKIEELAYGEHPRERMDVIWPDGPSKGIAIFVHGGFWIRLDKSYWTHFAEGARAQGWIVCMPSYTLAPEARISEITTQIGRAITKAATLHDGPIRLSGHSAGGHLVSRMICDDSPLDSAVLGRIERTVSISGLHDLRPLLHTKMNEDFRLDLQEATIESAALHLPVGHPDVIAWVGGGERPEFIRQTELLGMMWSGLEARIRVEIEGALNHFTILDGLRETNSPLTQAFVSEV
ncbi:alpha/beta hydrolase [Planktotalea sp.]|uniref:alpha/beta hydrolase n=1 Tax=Planktotalea sp. TaxID=2029877 RepID=UPI0032969800